jgi:site-specific DNA recombinase
MMDKKVIGYSRVSSQNQSKNTSLDYQNQKINEYCKLNELELSDVFKEVDSGGNNDRVILNSIRCMIQNETINTLIVWKLDRLGRTMLGSLQFIELCKQNDVRVISITDNIDSSNEQSTLMLNILLSIATEERRQIKSRCDGGRQYLWNQNKVPYPKLAYGYKRNKKGDVVIDENIKPIIEYIFKKWNLLSNMKHLSKSKRMRRLLKLLDRNGYKFNNNSFERWNVRDILQNSMYVGVIKWKDEVKNSDYEPMISRRLFNKIQVSLGTV